MLKSETRYTLDDAQDMLLWHISRGNFDSALQIYIERGREIPWFRRRFCFSCIQDGLSGHKSYRRVIKTAVIMLIVNLLIQPLFSVQLLDAFAFLLPRRFLYYNYFSALLPHILNVFFVFDLALQWYIWVALPGRLFERKTRFSSRVGFFALIALLSAYSVFRLVPFATDFPIVQSGGYLTRSISEEEMTAMVYGQILRSAPDREDVSAYLHQELREKYGIERPEDIPVYYYKSEQRLIGEAHLFYLDAEENYYKLSSLQLKATAYNDDAYPIVIKYLRNSKVILQIVNGWDAA
jgi:hypothetical protein